jgi:6-phosphogluconolactonase
MIRWHRLCSAVRTATWLLAALPPGTMAQAATFVYVGNAGSADISVLRLETETGALTPVETVAVPGVQRPGGATPIAVRPDRRVLYIGQRGEPLAVASFTIAADTGRLSPLGSGPLAGNMAFLATDRTGRFLLAASFADDRITVNAIAPDGRVGALVQSLDTPPKPHAIITDAANRHAMATSLGGDRLLRFGFDPAAGRLTPLSPADVPVRDGAGPRHLAFHPDGRILYVLNELGGSIDVFDYDAASGGLKAKQTASVLPPSFAGRPSAAELRLTADGRWLYASERTSSTLAGFAVAASDGTLQPIGHFATETQPRSFAIDPTGRFLIAAGQRTGRLAVHAIESTTGKLTRLESYAVGDNPNWVEIIALP